jgi:Plasmid encoded RepA protein
MIAQRSAYDRTGMAQIHDLILQQGIEATRAQTITKAERVAADAAFRVMTDEEQRIGIIHAGFAMTALPHRVTTETIWERQSGDVKLLLESGRTSLTESVGLPYGSVARMILLYLQTEAVKTRSRDVELGRSMNTWLNSMGMGNGGHNYNLVREQSKRLSLCRLTFLRVTPNQKFITNGSFVHDAILPNEDTDDNQLQFWRPCVRLDEGFFKSLIEHPLPVREAAIRSLGHRSMAIDIYLWLAYRLHVLEKPIKLTWHNLADQFGSGFADIKNFKKKFREPLALALAAYPDAKVLPESGGLVLHPSRPPVEPMGSGGTKLRVARAVDL